MPVMKKSTEAKEIPVADPDFKARAKELVAAVEAKRRAYDLSGQAREDHPNDG